MPHYWIVDTDARIFTRHVLRDDRLDGGTVLHEGDTLTCPLFPTITRNVIFAAIL